MAVLFSIADGNINATASWGVVEATSFQGTPNVAVSATIGALLNTGTSFTLTSAVTVAGVALQLSGRVTTPTGTFNVQLFDVTGAAIIGQVTINIADLPNSNGVGANHIDWTYFKFTSPVTTIAGRIYVIRAQASVASQISWHYTGATSNPNRALVTTTSQAPVANDPLIIAGSYTSAGINSNITITMNYNSSNTIANGNIWISSKGILTFATNMSTAMSINGYLVIGVGGTLIIGTSLTPVQSNYLAALQMNCTTALQYPIWVYGTMTTYGAVKTPGVKLINDSLVGATSSTLSSSPTGWLVNDLLAVTSTSRTYTELELKYISSVSSNIVNHTSQPNNYLHGGNATTKVQADVVNIYRNIYIQSIGDIFANKTNIQMFANSITSFYYTAFYSMGTGITVANSGICVNILNTGYTFEMQYCSIVQGNQASGYSSNTALFNQNTSGTTISNNIFYGLGWTTTVVSTIICTNFNDGNYIIGCLATSQVLLATNMGSNNVVSSNLWGASTGFFNNATNNSFYSNNQFGLVMNNPSTTGNLNLSNFLIWRNNSNGIVFNISGLGYQRNNIISFNGLYCFGNTTASITITTRSYQKIYFNNSFFYGGTTLVQPTHITNSNSAPVDALYYNNCYFGYSDTSLTTSPFSGSVFNGFFNNVSTIFSNCYFNGTLNQTGFYSGTNLNGNMISLNHDGVAGSNRQWVDIGTISTDFVIYKSAPKSLRMTIQFPTTLKMSSPPVRVPVKIGTTCTISVNVRKSVTGDGSVYGGTTPRLMYAFNPVLGNITETIGDITKNIFQYPQNFDNVYWTKTAITITPNSLSIAAPDGTFTADLFVEDNTTNRHRLLTSGTTLSIGTYNLSIYAKKANHDWIQVNPVTDNFNVNNWANFDLNTGTIGNTGVGASASITSVGDGWYRLSLQCNVIINGATFPTVCLSTNNTNSGRYPSYAGTLAQCFYIWGAQLTLGSTLLPYYENGQWEQLSYTTGTFSNDGVAEFYVDSDGSVGFINIDDWSVDTSVDSRGQDYWSVNGTYTEPDFKRGTTSYTFVK
jgi:hypothetical protein